MIGHDASVAAGGKYRLLAILSRDYIATGSQLHTALRKTQTGAATAHPQIAEVENHKLANFRSD